MERQQTCPDQSEVTVRALKYDGTEHRRWTAQLTSIDGSKVVLTGAFQTEVDHPLLGKIARGTVSVEYYWTDRWYSVFCFSEPTGELRNYYCNVNVPPTFDGSAMSFVDLDIDILVAPDFSYEVLDEDEFAENILRLRYPVDIQRSARKAVDELIRLIENRQFPFGTQP